MRVEVKNLMSDEEYQERWSQQRPGTLETLTAKEHEELWEVLDSLPLGG